MILLCCAEPLRIKAEVISYPHGKEVGPAHRILRADGEQRGWGVIVFHGIGDQWLTTERDVHQRLIEHLRDKRFWVAPVKGSSEAHTAFQVAEIAASAANVLLTSLNGPN